MTATVSAGEAQRAAAGRGGAALTGLAGLAALLAGASPLPVLVLSVVAAVLVLVRPHGNLPAIGFLVVLAIWVFWTPHATAWAVLAAAGLVGAHVLLAVGDATRGSVPLSAPVLVRLGRQTLLVLVVASVAAIVTTVHVTIAAAGHIWLGLLAFVVALGWVAWLRSRPDD